MILSRILPFNKLSKYRGYASNVVKLINVTIDDDTGYATVILNKPPVNSLNVELLSELSTVLTSLESQNSKGMILTSSLQTVFSAGLDIMEMYQPIPERMKIFWTVLQDVWLKLYGSTFPTVAVINGHAPAGGCLLASSCEYRIMLKNYTIGLNETQLGIVAPTWFIKSFENVVGKRQAELALTTGRMFTSSEALQIGLVDELRDNKADALKSAETFLSKYEMISPLARKESKDYFRKKEIEALRDNREKDMQIFMTGIQLPVVQQSLEFYLAVLKNKKDNI